MSDTVQAPGAEDRQVGVLDAAALPAVPPETAPSTPPLEDPVRELRLALVCYGGVSLAIYMHGITKELEKLVAASVAYERDQTSHSFSANDTASIYWALLRRLREASKERTRVVVDIVSGTSAGGINGVFLATALARNRSQEPLRTMWMEKGDIRKLLSGPPKLPRLARAAWAITRRKPVLDGDRISNWLLNALHQVDAQQKPLVAGVSSLLRPDDRLQLFVPITDFFGYNVEIPADDPAWIHDSAHRHVMHFVHDDRDPDCRQLAPAWNNALAFSARATSSFPGAFPPVSWSGYEEAVGHSPFEDGQSDRLFAPYRLTEQNPEKTHFVDGGVLDNKPFGTTLTAIKLRPAASEVDRRLIYVEPDPVTQAAEEPDGRPPKVLPTIIGGYAGIPRKEPIVGDLTELAVHNANVDRVRDIIETNFGPMRTHVLDHVKKHPSKDPERPTAAEIAAWRSDLDKRVEHDSGMLYPTYFRVRIRSVVDNFAQLIAQRRGYPPTSSHAMFVRRVLGEWGGRQGLFAKDGITDEQRRLVASLDISYQERHLRFLIAALSWWYRPDRTVTRPNPGSSRRRDPSWTQESTGCTKDSTSFRTWPSS